jgi:hypothetical protein
MNNIPHKPVAQEKKSKRKFNFIDFLVVLVIITVIGIAFYIFSPWSRIEKLWSNNQVEITYLVEINDVNPEDIELIKVGDPVKNSVTKNPLGTIVDVVSIENAYTYDYVLDQDGKMNAIVVENPQKYNVVIKISAYADYQDNVGYSVNGCRIAIGESFDLRFPLYSRGGSCTQLYT